jgi:ubiquinone/menaquinone biosynthesis C-methylase UbiE
MSEAHWQLDGDAPELYQRYLVPAITSKWAADLIGRAKPVAGEKVLDVACGTGVVARLAARMMGRGHVIGLDLNVGMLAVAQTQSSEGAPIEWIEGGALDLPFASDNFDLVVCQLGLQFFPDQGRALSEMRRVLSHSGRVALSVFSPIEQTTGANAFVQALDDELGAHASQIKRGEHTFRDPDQLRTLLTDAGFDAVQVQIVVQQIEFPSVLDYVRFQLLATPMAALLKDRGDIERSGTINSIATRTAGFSSAAMMRDGKFCFPQEAYVATARTSA